MRRLAFNLLRGQAPNLTNCDQGLATIDHHTTKREVRQALAACGADHHHDRHDLYQEERDRNRVAQSVQQRFGEIKAFAVLIAQLDRHDPHAPSRGGGGDGQGAVSEADKHDEHGKKEYADERGKRDNQKRKHNRECHINDPSDQAFAWHGRVKLWGADGVGLIGETLGHGPTVV
jgi:hypothetical protein